MSGKYSVLARDYGDTGWPIALYTNSKFKACRVWLKALFKYDLVDFTVRKCG